MLIISDTHTVSYSAHKQVLSTTVAEAFAYEKKPFTMETEHFVRTFDKFFDLMNMRSLREGVYKGKPNLLPYWDNSQSRDRLPASITSILHLNLLSKFLFFHFQWLEKDFIAYLDEWETSVNSRKDLSATEKPKLYLSRETLEGLRFTGEDINIMFALSNY